MHPHPFKPIKSKHTFITAKPQIAVFISHNTPHILNRLAIGITQGRKVDFMRRHRREQQASGTQPQQWVFHFTRVPVGEQAGAHRHGKRTAEFPYDVIQHVSPFRILRC